MTEHRIQDDGVSVREPGVLEIVAESRARLVSEGQLVLVAGELSEQRQLALGLGVDSRNARHLAVEQRRPVAMDECEIGQRRIEMSRWCEGQKWIGPIAIEVLMDDVAQATITEYALEKIVPLEKSGQTQRSLLR